MALIRDERLVKTGRSGRNREGREGREIMESEKEVFDHPQSLLLMLNKMAIFNLILHSVESVQRTKSEHTFQ